MCCSLRAAPAGPVDVHRVTRSDDTARRSLGSRRGTFSVAAALLTVMMCSIVSVPRAAASGVHAGQALVVILHDHVARAGPSMTRAR